MSALARVKPAGVIKLNVLVKLHGPVVPDAEQVTASSPNVPLGPVMVMNSAALAADGRATAAKLVTAARMNFFMRRLLTGHAI
jgi:hypothetical protein